jgi:voltage-gated potassium channel
MRKSVTTERPIESSMYELVMLTLSIFAIAGLAAKATVRMQPETETVIDYADYGICVVFFLDFVWSLYRAQDRKRYLVTWGWLDLLSSIPAIDVLRWGRLARVLRITRMIRGIRASRWLALIILRRRAENAFLAATVVAAMLIVLASVAILHFESGSQANITTAEDAIWWAFTTITTVGYGDHYPVTTEGRAVAVVLMCAGVGLFGTFSGFLASWFLATEEQDEGAAIEGIRAELEAIRMELAKLRSVDG